MDPLNDDELTELLHRWRAPAAPLGLEEKVFPAAQRMPWRRWLLSGSIRVPVPVALVAFVVLLSAIVFSLSARYPVLRPAAAVTLSDFQPVKQLQPRIIRSTYEGN
jgi:hypothetical protein